MSDGISAQVVCFEHSIAPAGRRTRLHVGRLKRSLSSVDVGFLPSWRARREAEAERISISGPLGNLLCCGSARIEGDDVAVNYPREAWALQGMVD